MKVLQSITDQIEKEMREELMQENYLNMSEKANIYDKLESYLAEEIASHTCNICTDLMVPPDHAPILLFPCGHTFCSTCISEYKIKYSKNQCPCCRAKVSY